MNHLLNEQHDKAIDSFIQLLEVDSSTVEIHFALGNLYRRQGEVERSIRIHQNLIARPLLGKSERSKALYELGLDYVKAGLLDRAESLFKELSEDACFKQNAQEQLLDIYQDEKEWQKAISCVERLKKSKSRNWNFLLSHFYCELAIRCFSKNELSEASVYLKRSLAVEPECARAEMLLADIEFKSGQYQAAINFYRKVITKTPDLIVEVLDPIGECFDRLSLKGQKINFLRENSVKQEQVIFRCGQEIFRQEGAVQAFDFLVTKVSQAPSFNGLIELLEAQGRLEADVIGGSLEISKVARRLRQVSFYKCEECGFQASELHWQCPACKRWGKVSRVQAL
jgi:lipopolysaccharide biosynthesis regulator YciM